MKKTLVGIEISHKSNGIDIFLTFLPHEYQHIKIEKDNSREFWQKANGEWEMIENKKVTEI